jgi:hypothetical protein
MSCPCCLQTPCVSLCRMPQELEATIVSNGVLNSSGVTAAEITAIEGFIEGTYSLQYSQYISNRAEYIFNFPDPPYDYLGAAGNYLQYNWFCNPVGDTGGMLIRACSTTSTDPYRRFEGGVPFNGGNATAANGFPSITNYCSGTAFSGVLSMQCFFFPDTTCGGSPAGARYAYFDFSVTVTD